MAIHRVACSECKTKITIKCNAGGLSEEELRNQLTYANAKLEWLVMAACDINKMVYKAHSLHQPLTDEQVAVLVAGIAMLPDGVGRNILRKRIIDTRGLPNGYMVMDVFMHVFDELMAARGLTEYVKNEERQSLSQAAEVAAEYQERIDLTAYFDRIPPDSKGH